MKCVTNGVGAQKRCTMTMTLSRALCRGYHGDESPTLLLSVLIARKKKQCLEHSVCINERERTGIASSSP